VSQGLASTARKVQLLILPCFFAALFIFAEIIQLSIAVCIFGR